MIKYSSKTTYKISKSYHLRFILLYDKICKIYTISFIQIPIFFHFHNSRGVFVNSRLRISSLLQVTIGEGSSPYLGEAALERLIEL